MESIEEISQVQRVLLHGFLMAAFDYSHACPRQHTWQRAAEGFVNRPDLGEVGDFGRAANVGGGGQQEVLNDRPQSNVGAEAGAAVSGELDQLFPAEGAVRSLYIEAVIAAGEGHAAPLVHYK